MKTRRFKQVGILRSRATSPLAGRTFPRGHRSTARRQWHADRAARRAGRKVGICGQAPSDYPEMVRFLVERGVTSISLNPDAVVHGLEAVAAAEAAGSSTGDPRGRRSNKEH